VFTIDITTLVFYHSLFFMAAKIDNATRGTQKGAPWTHRAIKKRRNSFIINES